MCMRLAANALSLELQVHCQEALICRRQEGDELRFWAASSRSYVSSVICLQDPSILTSLFAMLSDSV